MSRATLLTAAIIAGVIGLLVLTRDKGGTSHPIKAPPGMIIRVKPLFAELSLDGPFGALRQSNVDPRASGIKGVTV
jgi:hypothetical protein